MSMKIIVFGDQNLESGFLKAGELCGHSVRFVSTGLSAQTAAEACPDAVVLIVPSPAALLQDFLVELCEACAVHPLLLLFERQPDGRCFFVESIEADGALQTFFRRAVGEENAVFLQYPEESWRQRFPQAFENQQRREATKMMLYGVTRAEFLKSREQYGLRLDESDFYLFMWELDKTALVDYAVNKSIHHFLHALRLEDLDRVLREHDGGEIVFTDISFAYILINAPAPAGTRRQQADRIALALAQAAGRRSTHCFISDLLHDPEEINRGHRDFKRSCAYRFFCQEAVAISNDYIKSHQRWFSREEIRQTIEAIQHYLSFDIGNKELPALIRHLYLKIVKPSMSYNLYYLVSESILQSLKDELSVKLLMEAIDSPWLMLITQLGTIEESCARVLECINTLAGQQVKTHNISNSTVRKVLRYIEEHYAEPLSVAGIAKDFNVSVSYLSQCFKRETGVGIKRYLTMCRMQRAKKLLLSTDDSVGAIAMAVGYDDFRQFSKMFKVFTGVTPAQCRKGMMEKSSVSLRETHFFP